MITGIPRRSFLSFLAACASAGEAPRKKAKPQLPRAGEFARYLDAATEQPVVRLTNLSSASYLPNTANRFMSPRERFLVFSSDREGKLAPFTMDLRTGIASQLAPTERLQPASLNLAASGRLVHLLDGGSLKEVNLPSRKTIEVAADVTAFSRGPTRTDTVIVRAGKLTRLGAPADVWADAVSGLCMLRPGGAGCLFTRADTNEELWYVCFRQGASPKPVVVARGRFANPCWSADGRTLLLLRDTPAGSSEIHEIDPDIGLASERVVAKTSRFASFSANEDGSVFVGASRSKAQPSVILLVRTVQRELTLCEHRASDPANVHPAFSPDSRRIYFQSDFQGKPAIYAVNVESLVEPTAS